MNQLDSTLQQLRGFIRQIEALRQSDFPYTHSEEALDVIGRAFSKIDNNLRLFDATTDATVVETSCSTAIANIENYLRILGFILRSTNVRNSFEIYRPILQLSNVVIGPNAKVILSSEWDYSPFVYMNVSALMRNFIFIGLPAHETANSLLIPLAGHEIGHPLWDNENLESQIKPVLENQIISQIQARWDEFKLLYPAQTATTVKKDKLGELDAKALWIDALIYSTKQAEETFCDIVGLRLFGESYLHAFAYFMAPDKSGARSFAYPCPSERCNSLLGAAKEFGINATPEYAKQFAKCSLPKGAEKRFNVELADSACISARPVIINQVKSICTAKGIAIRDEDKVNDICKSFHHSVPATNALSLANILNAAWKHVEQKSLFDHTKDNDEAIDVLNELVFKSIEILDFETIVGHI